MPPIDRQPSIFVLASEDPKDAPLADELRTHLKVMQRSTGIDILSDVELRIGDEYRKETQQAIDQVDIALLLLSADFFVSDWLMEDMVPQLQQRHSLGKLRVIAVLLRSCQWDVLPWFSELHLLPKHRKPIGSFSPYERDEVLNEVAKEIMELVAPEATRSSQDGRAAPELLSLVVLGPHVVAEGKRIAVSGNSWTVRIDRFLLGDTSALSHVSEDSGNLNPEDRYIALSDPGEARALAGAISWRAEKDYIEAQVPVAPPRPKRTVMTVESTSLDLMNVVHGVEAAVELQVWLGTALGMLDKRLGCHIPEWLQTTELAPRLADLVKVEIWRLASVPQIDELTSEVFSPFDFVEQVSRVQPRIEEADDETIPVDIELTFIGGGPWKGEIRVARRPADPNARDKILQELEAHLARSLGTKSVFGGARAGMAAKPGSPSNSDD